MIEWLIGAGVGMCVGLFWGRRSALDEVNRLRVLCGLAGEDPNDPAECVSQDGSCPSCRRGAPEFYAKGQGRSSKGWYQRRECAHCTFGFIVYTK